MYSSRIHTSVYIHTGEINNIYIFIHKVMYRNTRLCTCIHIHTCKHAISIKLLVEKIWMQSERNCGCSHTMLPACSNLGCRHHLNLMLSSFVCLSISFMWNLHGIGLRHPLHLVDGCICSWKRLVNTFNWNKKSVWYLWSPRNIQVEKIKGRKKICRPHVSFFEAPSPSFLPIALNFDGWQPFSIWIMDLPRLRCSSARASGWRRGVRGLVQFRLNSANWSSTCEQWWASGHLFHMLKTTLLCFNGRISHTILEWLEHDRNQIAAICDQNFCKPSWFESPVMAFGPTTSATSSWAKSSSSSS